MFIRLDSKQIVDVTALGQQHKVSIGKTGENKTNVFIRLVIWSSAGLSSISSMLKLILLRVREIVFRICLNIVL